MVLEESCRDALAWEPETGSRRSSVAVNLSARQLKRPGFSSEVRDALERTGLEPSRLVLEISEGIVMEDALTAAGVLRDLKDLGIELSLDDFGTGSTSLSQLRRFPLDTLKIDRVFVQGLGENPEDTVIVQAMMSLAHALGLSVVAEGVELQSQRQILEKLQCDLVQGFLISRAVHRSSVADLLERREWTGAGIA
jgi:EAL domain-containing protein (putative c-di-GMP-specific phosphodiesterase class I)